MWNPESCSDRDEQDLSDLDEQDHDEEGQISADRRWGKDHVRLQLE